MIITFTIFSGKTQTNKDEIRRRLFFTARPAELTDEEVDGHHVPGFRGFHGHSLLFLFSRLCSRLHSQWQSGASKYWQGTHEERGEEGILSLYQKMSLYFYRQLHFQLSQGLDQIAQAAKCLNRFSSSSQVQDSKQGSLKAPGRKKNLLLPDSYKTQRMRKRTQMTKLSGLFLPAVCPLP